MNKLKTIYLQEFDKIYGGGWQCVVGSNFGCYFTHKHGTFIYFSLEILNFLIFKAAITPSSWSIKVTTNEMMMLLIIATGN